jgi:hypothetical protein
MRRLFARIARQAVLGSVLLIATAGEGAGVAAADTSDAFSFPVNPTDVIGVTDSVTGTMITAEGFLYSDFGELMFFASRGEAPIAPRVKTLRSGYQPVVDYQVERDGIRYAFTAFAGRLNGNPNGPVLDFVRVRMTNVSGGPATAVVASGFRYRGDGNRYDRPRKPEHPGDHLHLGTAFDKAWTYGSTGAGLTRSGKLVYLFPRQHPHDFRYRFADTRHIAGAAPARTLPVGPQTPVGIARYRLALQPGESKDLDWIMPVIPVAAGSPQARAIAAARFDSHLAPTMRGWDDIIARGMQIDLPEAKVVDTFKANLIYDLIARYSLDGVAVQTVNDFQYHAFFLRDAAFFSNMYLQTGYPDIARATLDFFPRMQRADGLFLSQEGQYDGIGQTLWIYGRYYAMTGDRSFADRVFPSVVRAMDWLRRARASEPLGILPASDPHDNEDISGHITGYNFWALAGMANAAALARATGHDAEAAKWSAERDAYKASFVALLRERTAKSGGYIPPGLDGKGGQDWDNMAALFPTSALDPDEPMVRATLAATRANYQEGLPLWRGTLHGYNGFTNAETALILGEQRMAVADLYAALVHTTSTHGGFEVDIKPWGNRELSWNVTPHGWFGARYRSMLRDMLVREEGDDLHLLSAISPAWLVPGKPLSVTRAPTQFGSLGYTLATDADGGDLTIAADFRAPPHAVVVHIPWFVRSVSAVVDGRPAAIAGDRLVLPASARHVRFHWQRMPEPALSYDAAVTDLMNQYRLRAGRTAAPK